MKKRERCSVCSERDIDCIATKVGSISPDSEVTETVLTIYYDNPNCVHPEGKKHYKAITSAKQRNRRESLLRQSVSSENAGFSNQKEYDTPFADMPPWLKPIYCLLDTYYKFRECPKNIHLRMDELPYDVQIIFRENKVDTMDDIRLLFHYLVTARENQISVLPPRHSGR